MGEQLKANVQVRDFKIPEYPLLLTPSMPKDSSTLKQDNTSS